MITIEYLRKKDGKWQAITSGCGCCADTLESGEIDIKDIKEYREDLKKQLKLVDDFLLEMMNKMNNEINDEMSFEIYYKGWK